MNILIVSENFLNGGLETHINSIVESLEDKANFFYAFREYNQNWDFKNVYTGFNFLYNSTVAQFCEDVDRLIEIVKNNKIDIIHAHPFYSLFPSVFAAKISGIPIIYSYHGMGSYNFTSQPVDTVLFNMFTDYEIDKFFCVSNEGKQIIDNIIFDKNKTIFLPNSIDINRFKKQNINKNKSWALISRLAIDKIAEIKKLVSIINELDITELHIIGDGSEKENLNNFIINNNLSNRVFLDGQKNDIPSEISNKFNGIIGIGRVAMEGISMQLPVLLIGYKKIAGIIDDKLYHKIESYNFVNRYIPNINIELLKSQIQNVYNDTYEHSFYDEFKNKFASNIVSNIYYKELCNLSCSSLIDMAALFDEVKTLDGSIDFYGNYFVYNIIKKYFISFIRLHHQKNLFITFDHFFLQNEKINSINKQYINQENELINVNNKLLEQNNIITKQKQLLEEQEKTINEINQNTMTLRNLKRKLKYKFKH